MTTANDDLHAMTELDAPQRREFVQNNRVCLYGYGRQHAGPSMSLCYYVMDGDATIETDLELATNTCARLMGFEIEYETAAAAKHTEEQMVKLRELMQLEDRLVIRVTPDETFYSPATRGKSLDELIEFRRNLEGNPVQVGQMLPWR